MTVVICGAGVIGACTAYFLSRRGVAVVVVERRGVACAASGKSGGFLGLDWCDGSPLAPLARRSFALHAELAACFPGVWDYRRVDTFAVAASARRPPGAAGRRSGGPDWLGASAFVRGRLGTPATTAQVDPARFTRGMMDAAIAAGARLRLGCVAGLRRGPDGATVTGVIVDGEVLAADAVVIAMGPWSALAGRWLPLPAVHGLKGNSIVLRTDAPLPAQSLFVELEAADGAAHAPEIFPRPDGTTYVCGLSSEQPLRDDPAEVGPDAGAGARLQALTAIVAPRLGAASVETVQACCRPVTGDGLPLIGRAAGVAGAYVATGHSVWGMLNGPATGEAMAELIADGRARTVDLAPFAPSRLPPVA